ncbi:NAD(P)-dependent alcohol dehydrogenase [Stigmatella sp. ncwal1]|uniref:NAD(P)-dependent alcohol dehydrogenase n=1 Tax=Stigmatella ashevillensis TaxID=2995309 RepID=A0ABT5DFW8_9BACT|nr:NAD(P)-dependent alcohol dehydrogenase [Stigmatella ashevillena]MDC0711969.1 NAD(P)-dependent alcohol dehydrogenase [Stigmatella ashevillena]
MPTTPAYAAPSAKAPLAPFSVERREPGPHDVVIDIHYCGVCHSDIHQARDEWGGALFPMVPGHEIVGRVAQAGGSVSRYKVGDAVGVGCFVDSCRECSWCRKGEEQYCERGMNSTYNGRERNGQPTYGGYSTRITVDENYVLRIPESLPLDRAAPLLCAGITTYSPLRSYGLKPGDTLAVVGLGGLGHMGVKLGKALGAEVTVLSTSPSKEKDAKALGATHFAATSNKDTFQKLARKFNFILDTVSAEHDYNAYLNLLKTDGTMILVGAPETPSKLGAFSLIGRRLKLGGSMIGGIRETQEMLDFCAKHNVASDVEVIPIQKINEAYERMLKGDVRYRFVIDLNSLKK